LIHHPYHPYVLHSPKNVNPSSEFTKEQPDSSSSFCCSNNFKNVLWESSPVMPFVTQLQAIAERKLTCVNMSRAQLKNMPTMQYDQIESHTDHGELSQSYVGGDFDNKYNGYGGSNDKICVICLESFQVGDTVRVLPNCLHTFHKSCIDHFLLGLSADIDAITSFCPTCRTDSSGAGEANTHSPPQLSSPNLSDAPTSPPPQFEEIADAIFASMGGLMEEENDSLQESSISCDNLDSSEYIMLSFTPEPLYDTKVIEDEDFLCDIMSPND
jgi:hypothetical protein